MANLNAALTHLLRARRQVAPPPPDAVRAKARDVCAAHGVTVPPDSALRD